MVPVDTGPSFTHLIHISLHLKFFPSTFQTLAVYYLFSNAGTYFTPSLTRKVILPYGYIGYTASSVPAILIFDVSSTLSRTWVSNRQSADRMSAAR